MKSTGTALLGEQPQINYETLANKDKPSISQRGKILGISACLATVAVIIIVLVVVTATGSTNQIVYSAECDIHPDYNLGFRCTVTVMKPDSDDCPNAIVTYHREDMVGDYLERTMEMKSNPDSPGVDPDHWCIYTADLLRFVPNTSYTFSFFNSDSQSHWESITRSSGFTGFEAMDTGSSFFIFVIGTPSYDDLIFTFYDRYHVALDKLGFPVWYVDNGCRVAYVSQLETYNLGMHNCDTTGLQEMTPFGVIVDDLEIPYCDTLTAGTVWRGQALESLGSNVHPNMFAWQDYMLEHTHSGNWTSRVIMWNRSVDEYTMVIDLADVFDVETDRSPMDPVIYEDILYRKYNLKLCPGELEEDFQIYDWTHANSISVSDDGLLLILSSQHLSAVIAVSTIDFSLQWMVSSTLSSSMFEFVNESEKFYGQHHPQIVKGNNIIMIDDGNGREDEEGQWKSRCSEYHLDWESMTIDRVWSYELEQRSKTGHMGSVTHTENGTRICVFSCDRNNDDADCFLRFFEFVSSTGLDTLPSEPTYYDTLSAHYFMPPLEDPSDDFTNVPNPGGYRGELYKSMNGEYKAKGA